MGEQSSRTAGDQEERPWFRYRRQRIRHVVRREVGRRIAWRIPGWIAFGIALGIAARGIAAAAVCRSSAFA